MNYSEQDLEALLKNNPSVKVHKTNNPHFANIKRVDPEQYIEQQTEKMKSKYRNKKIKVDGILFDSQKEADYYSELKLLLQAGEIKGFCRQPEFILQEGIDKVRPITYMADFIVWNKDDVEVIDTKGFKTDVYKIKRKMFQKKFPLMELIEK